MKPLGQKSYGSIPHFSNSRVGSGDYHCEHGQEVIATVKPRDRDDLIIVQEKLDGSNVAVAKVNGEILALNRAGYLATTSPFEQHHYFALWVDSQKDRFHALLDEGERLSGEWLMQAHSTRYELKHEPFVAFDLIRKHQRHTYHDFLLRVLPLGFVVPKLLHLGQPIDVPSIMNKIDAEGSGHGAIDKVEGAVWRVERLGKVDFLAKYVRSDKQDGIYLPEVSGGDAVWNYPPHQITGINN